MLFILSGSALLQVTVGDVNDNGPYFTNFTATVTEEQSPEVPVTNLTPFTRDPDSLINQGPYRYQQLPGNHRAYNFFKIESSGQVKTIQPIDREVDVSFNVPVLVIDNGLPTQSSSLTFKISVVDINDSQPRPRFATAYLSLYDGALPTSAIADVRPLDDDVVGTYTCEFEGSGNPTSVFSINPNSCELNVISQPQEAAYTLQIQGDDGTMRPVTYGIDVNIMMFDNSTLEHSMIVQIADITAENFMEYKYTNFLRAVQQAFGSQDIIKLIGFTQHQSGDLLLHIAAVSFVDNEYYSKEALRQKLYLAKNHTEKEAGIFIVGMAYSACGVNHCKNGGHCSSLVNVQRTSFVVDSPFHIFSNPELDISVYCVCPPEFTGPDCSLQATPCGSRYCHNGGVCVNEECECPSTWTGPSCERDINECKQGVCKNGATCENTQGSYVCHCQDGYFGKNCQEGDNYCRSSPCVYGTCENLVDTFKCHCKYGYFGQTCQLSTFGFHESSYLEFPTLTALSSLEVTFATKRQNSLLLYSPSSQGNNFVALEVVQGFVQFSVSLGAGEITRLSVAKAVNTGAWFRVKVARNAEVGTFSVH